MAGPTRCQRRGTPLSGVPGSVVTCVRDVSGERGLAFAASGNEFVTDASGKHVVRLLEPGQFSFQVLHPLLQTAHFRKHAGIRPADVAEDSLRHCSGSSTLSDQSGRTREDTHKCAQGDISRIAPSRVSGQVERSRRSKAPGAAGPAAGAWLAGWAAVRGPVHERVAADRRAASWARLALASVNSE